MFFGITKYNKKARVSNLFFNNKKNLCRIPTIKYIKFGCI